jgi:hypothetical protein
MRTISLSWAETFLERTTIMGTLEFNCAQRCPIIRPKRGKNKLAGKHIEIVVVFWAHFRREAPETGLSAPIFFTAMRQKSISASIPCAFRGWQRRRSDHTPKSGRTPDFGGGSCGNGGYLFAYQFTDDLSGAFMVSLSFSPEVVHSQIIQPQKPGIPAAYKAGAVGACFGYMGSIVFIERIRFFFSQFRHRVLLSFKQRDQCGAALHGMKHLHRILINDIIQYLKQIGIAVKADEQVFRGVTFFTHRVILRDFERPPYIGFTYTVFESRLPESNSNVH